jgi:hypothetical protein
MGELNTFDDRSVKKIADTVAYVEDITQKQAAGQRQFGDNDFKVKLTSETVTPGEWNASEVVWDGSAFVIPTDAETWDTTTPLIVTGVAGAVDDILTAESLADTSNETVWLAIKPAGGGGSSLTWIKTDADETDGTGTGTVYAYRGSVTPLQEGDPLANIVVTWNAPDVASKGTIKAGNWFCCTENAGVYYPINIPVVL